MKQFFPARSVKGTHREKLNFFRKRKKRKTDAGANSPHISEQLNRHIGHGER